MQAESRAVCAGGGPGYTAPMSISVFLFAAAISECTGGFESSMTPEEGVPHYETLAGAIELYAEPNAAAMLAGRVSPPAGTRFESAEARFRTLEPAPVTLKVPLRARGRSFGCIGLLTREAYYRSEQPSADMNLPAGTAFEYLQYRAEGTCFVRIDGAVLDTDDLCPTVDRELFEMPAEPATELWIRTTLDGVTGWVRIDEIKTHERCREPYSC